MAVKETLEKKLNISPEEQQQYDKDLEHFKLKVDNMGRSGRKTVRKLRAIADRNHEAWTVFKLKYAFASFLGIVGGLLSRYSTRGYVALGLLFAGAAVASQASLEQYARDLKDYKTAEQYLNESLESYIEFRKFLRDLSITKDTVRMIYIYQVAEVHGVITTQVSTILLRHIFDTIEAPWNTVLPLLLNSQTIRVASPQTNFYTVFNTAFLVLDTMELGFSIFDLFQNKGSDLARDLREKASEIELGLTVIGTWIIGTV